MPAALLYNQLLSLTGTTKTDFAQCMYLTPSAFSKLMSEDKLYTYKDKSTFVSNSAAYFAKKIYSPGCYLKLKEIFPVIYDFPNILELEIFIRQSIEYTLNKSAVIAKSNTSESFLTFLGYRNITNMICIVMSDYLMNSKIDVLEYYETLLWSNEINTKIFKDIKFMPASSKAKMKSNHIFTISSLEASLDLQNVSFFERLYGMFHYSDMDFWMTNNPIEPAFILLKGELIMYLSCLHDNTPCMTIIDDKAQITRLFQSIFNHKIEKVSFNKKEVIDLVNNDAYTREFFSMHRILGTFSFVPLGYLVNKEELDKMEGNQIMKDMLLSLNDRIMNDKNIFASASLIVDYFKIYGKLHLPFIGIINFPPNKRKEYLKRYDHYVENDVPENIRFIHLSVGLTTFVCFEKVALVYMTNEEQTIEKLYYLRTDKVFDILNKATQYNIATQYLTSTFWNQLSSDNNQ